MLHEPVSSTTGLRVGGQDHLLQPGVRGLRYSALPCLDMASGVANLTDADYDALYVVVKEQMPRITREMFPAALAQLVDQGVLEILATEDEIAVRMPVV